MGHYWSEMRGPETEAERQQRIANTLANRLRTLPASRFSVNEIALLTRAGWSQYKDNYYESECREICAIAHREGVTAE